MKELPDKSIDCFICDLPYGCLKVKKTDKWMEQYKRTDDGAHGGCAWDVKIDLEKFWEQVKRLSKNDDTAVIHFCNTRFGAELIASNPSWFRYDLVWNKERGVSFLHANKMPMKSHEMVYIFSKKGTYYKRVDIEGVYPNTKRGKGTKQSNVYGIPYTEEHFKPDTSTTHRCALSVINCQTKAVKGRHPTQKPVELYKWLLERYCPEGGTILDPTAGSFSSCIAGKELGLNCIGMEKDDKFYEKAMKIKEALS
jgi:site-specific DNA-methyltransferase (adenine-specific)